jgi:hypothetical protein
MGDVMKTWTVLVMLAVMGMSSAALASGKLSLQMNRYFREEVVKPSAGLAVYEKLPFGWAYNGWSGAGVRPHLHSEDVTWFATKHDLETWIYMVGLSFGYLGEYNTNEGPVQHSLHVKTTFQLW